ncbi:ubiquitin-specific protease otu1 [Agyrium rufum]|nr:ubiquitin-specific protease otu1 [Agyrium rufum]
MKLRIRGPDGQSAVSLADDASISDLKQEIAKATDVPEFDIKFGFPPKPLILDDYPQSTKLADLSIRLSGETLIINPKYYDIPNPEPPARKSPSKPHPPSTRPTQSSSSTRQQQPRNIDPETAASDPPEIPLPSHSSTLVLRIMPDDNSCLFRAFNTAFFGPSMDNMHELRSIVAQAIQRDPEQYNTAILGKPPNDYCRWIQSSDSWGGAIELGILAREFGIEICSVDVQTLRVDRFQEGKEKRCILVYSGIHYDVIAMSPSDPPYEKAYAPPDFDVLVFDSQDDLVLQGAVELCAALQKQGYFTDTAGFSIRCGDCGGLFKGEKGALEHAQQTGHYDFQEANP